MWLICIVFCKGIRAICAADVHCIARAMVRSKCSAVQGHTHAAVLQRLSLEGHIKKASTAAVKKALGLLKDKAAPGLNPTKPPPAVLPDGFDGSKLPPLNSSSAKAVEDTAPLVFLYRWLELRSGVSHCAVVAAGETAMTGHQRFLPDQNQCAAQRKPSEKPGNASLKAARV